MKLYGMCKIYGECVCGLCQIFNAKSVKRTKDGLEITVDEEMEDTHES